MAHVVGARSFSLLMSLHLSGTLLRQVQPLFYKGPRRVENWAGDDTAS